MALSIKSMMIPCFASLFRGMVLRSGKLCWLHALCMLLRYLVRINIDYTLMFIRLSIA